MAAIALNSSVPVSVKCRIGVDDRDTYGQLCEFVDTVSSRSPTMHFIIHARKALLKGLNPAENRRVPPLKYEYYFALLRDFPDLQFTINGGITDIDEVVAARSQGAHGVMVGRAAYKNSWSMLGHIDSVIYGMPASTISRRQIIEKFQAYSDSVIGQYGPNRPSLRLVVKSLLNIFHSEPGNGLWKCKVDDAMRRCKTVKSLLEETLEAIPDSILDAPLLRQSSACKTAAFTDVHRLMPPPYKEARKEETVYA